MARQLLTDEILAQVGTVARERTGLVTADGIARYCSGILDERPAHIDRSAARALGNPDRTIASGSSCSPEKTLSQHTFSLSYRLAFLFPHHRLSANHKAGLERLTTCVSCFQR
jgi:hypothetical protein